jgi:predicted Zn-dependent peptidase
MNRLGVQELVHGRQLGYREAISRIDAVQIDDIRLMLRHIMSAGAFAVTSLGPPAHKETMKKLFS